MYINKFDIVYVNVFVKIFLEKILKKETLYTYTIMFKNKHTHTKSNFKNKVLKYIQRERKIYKQFKNKYKKSYSAKYKFNYKLQLNIIYYIFFA